MHGPAVHDLGLQAITACPVCVDASVRLGSLLPFLGEGGKLLPGRVQAYGNAQTVCPWAKNGQPGSRTPVITVSGRRRRRARGYYQQTDIWLSSNTFGPRYRPHIGTYPSGTGYEASSEIQAPAPSRPGPSMAVWHLSPSKLQSCIVDRAACLVPVARFILPQ